MRRLYILFFLLCTALPVHATVNEDPSANRYVANGTVTAFPYTFKIVNKANIAVLANTATRAVDVDFTVSGVGSDTGGTVTFLTAPDAGTIVSIMRAQPASQLSRYQTHEAFPSTRIETDHDKMVMLLQQLKEAQARSYHLPASETGTSASTTLPDAAARASKVAGWDSSGFPIAIDAATVGSGGGGGGGGGSGSSSDSLVTATGTTTARTLAERFAAAVDVKDEGAVGDGATNARQAFLDADADTTGPITCSAGTYLITSNTTISSPVHVTGCIIKLTTGVTLTLTGGVLAADTRQIFDVTAAGSAINVGGRIRPEWYGDVTTDATAEIQAALNSAAFNGGTVVLRAGVSYPVSATLTISASNVTLAGEGAWSSTLTRSTNYGDTIVVTGNDATGTVVSSIGIQNLTFSSTGLVTSGAHIHLNGVTRIRISTIFMSNGFIGFHFAGTSQSYIDNIHLTFNNIYGGSATGRKYMWFTTAAATYATSGNGGIFVENFNMRASSPFTQNEYGLEINNADGMWFSNGHLGGTTSGNLRLYANDANNVIGLVNFSNVMSDASTGPGLVFEGSTNNGHGIRFTNMEMKGGAGGTVGLSVLAGAKFYDVQFVNCAASEFSSHGILMMSAEAKGWEYIGCEIRGNSDGTVNTADGYYLGAGDKIHILGGSSGGSNVSPSGTQTQRYGINIQSGVTNTLISGLELTRNLTAPLLIDSAARETTLLTGLVTGESHYVASAATIDMPFGLDMYRLTGTTTVNTILAPTMKRVITLIASGNVTLSVAGNLKLAGGVDYDMTNQDTVTLRYEEQGPFWLEIGRSVN